MAGVNQKSHSHHQMDWASPTEHMLWATKADVEVSDNKMMIGNLSTNNVYGKGHMVCHLQGHVIGWRRGPKARYSMCPPLKWRRPRRPETSS
jgi:hypothetical protein